jgi:hypothetical protein
MTLTTESKFELIHSKIARSLKEALFKESITPEGEKPVRMELHVPYNQIRPDEETEDTATATVTYVVWCPSEKKHTVNIKFNYDKHGKFIRNSMVYV